jgi:hypothetical protein
MHTRAHHKAKLRSFLSIFVPKSSFLFGIDFEMWEKRLVLVVKMATVLEYTTKEQRSVAHFCGQKDSMQIIFVKNFFLFTVGSVCHVKRFIIR